MKEISLNIVEIDNIAKLELAEAYIELGDNESAIKIIREIEKTGETHEKESARQLTSQL